MTSITIVLSMYKDISLKNLAEYLDSIYVQTYKSDIFIKIDGQILDILMNVVQHQASFEL